MKTREWTPKRLSAAKRAVAREAAAMPLFPELRRFNTVDERVAQMDERERELMGRLRGHDAKSWREARRRLRWLTLEDRALALKQFKILPHNPAYLMDVIRHLHCEL